MNIDSILEELSYRIDTGIVDLSDPKHFVVLQDLLTENGVNNANEIAQKAVLNFIQLREKQDYTAAREKELANILKQKINNPETKKPIQVSTALGYGKGHPAYAPALQMLKSKEFSEKDIDIVDAEPEEEIPSSRKKTKTTEPKKLGGAEFASSAEKRQQATEPKPEPVKDNKEDTFVDKNVYDAIKQFENYLSDAQKKVIELSQKKRIAELKKLDTLADSFKKLPKEIRNTASTIFAKGQIYEGRENSGIGKNRLGFIDVKTLNSNRDYLINAYGDGSPDKIKIFVRNSRKIKVSEEYVNSSFELLPESLQTSLMGKGKTGDSGKDKHFLGYIKEDGSTTSDRTDSNIKKDKKGNLTIKRGNPGNKDRGKFVWRCILEQGGQDPYSGLPLDFSSIDLEHVCAFDNRDKGNPSESDYLNREHDDNIIICATNLNQKKSNHSMKKFFEMHVNPQVGKSEESFKKETETFETINNVASQTDQKAGLVVKDGKIKSGHDFKKLKELFDMDDSIYISARNEFKKVAETEEDKKAIQTLNSEIGKSIIMAMGLGRGLIDKSGRRTIKLSSDNLYRGFILSMGEQMNRQDEFKEAWEQARKVGNSDEFRLKGKGQQAMIKYLIDNKFISKTVLNDQKLGKVFRNALTEVYDYNNNRYILIIN